MVRGRLRYIVNAFNNPFMIYGTGGFAYGQVESSITTTTTYHNVTSPIGGPATVGPTMSHIDKYGRVKVRFGWELGGGVEFPLAKNWTLGVEYLHIDFGKFDFTVPPAATITTRVKNDIVRLKLNWYFTPESPTGTVKWFNTTKGHGFIAPEEGG